MNRYERYTRSDAFYIVWPAFENPVVFIGPLTDENGRVINKYFLDYFAESIDTWVFTKDNYSAFPEHWDELLGVLVDVEEDGSCRGITGPHQACVIARKLEGENLYYDGGDNLRSTLIGLV